MIHAASRADPLHRCENTDRAITDGIRVTTPLQHTAPWPTRSSWTSINRSVITVPNTRIVGARFVRHDHDIARTSAEPCDFRYGMSWRATLRGGAIFPKTVEPPTQSPSTADANPYSTGGAS
jgi:hypothetical protein